jgi:hypothetical protein
MLFAFISAHHDDFFWIATLPGDNPANKGFAKRASSTSDEDSLFFQYALHAISF